MEGQGAESSFNPSRGLVTASLPLPSLPSQPQHQPHPHPRKRHLTVLGSHSEGRGHHKAGGLGDRSPFRLCSAPEQLCPSVGVCISTTREAQLSGLCEGSFCSDSLRFLAKNDPLAWRLPLGGLEPPQTQHPPLLTLSLNLLARGGEGEGLAVSVRRQNNV